MILLKQQIQVIPVGVILRDAKRLVKSRVGHDDSVFLIRKAYAVCDVIEDGLGHISGVDGLAELSVGNFQRLHDVADIISGNLIGQIPPEDETE